ncbi:phytanoyl-CoA dioxygenase family protein [Aquisalimonas sp.]|uniref:phytanoyl-CoA dioxygenase family protein n=2 Tax=Aquisalimonas TaxID=406099 RepID=UPI0025BD7A9D|nr:phytanoyl-CoA dioxygenase family protein [Aquisalimonas sp.]
MASFFLTSDPLPEQARNERVYRGDLIVFRGSAAVADLVGALQAICRQHLGADPESVHERFPEAAVNAAAQALRDEIAADDTVTAMLRTALQAVGVRIDDTYGDGLELRVQSASSGSGGRLISPLGVHRDTWGSNIMAQTNWWAPVWPTTPERTIAFFPAYFERPVPNTSAGWDFGKLLRRLKADGPDTDYPLLPLAAEPPGWEEAMPVSIEPGDLLCFSGAHLHASVPNATERTRLSFELRTANRPDVQAGRGAPNVDGTPVRTTYQLFRGLNHGERLGSLE